MKALSIKQPWAWAILHAGKDVENRSWMTRFRGRIAIHASKTIDKDAVQLLRAKGYDVPMNLPTGGLAGEVDIVDCIDNWLGDKVSSPWAEYDKCLMLENPKAYPEIIPFEGRLGLFEVPDQ